MITNIKVIELVYRLMSIRGIGVVQTNKFLLSLQQNSDHVRMEQQIRTFLNDVQRDGFDNADVQVYTLNSPFDVKFISVLDIEYPGELKKCLSTNTPPVLSYIGNINLLNSKKVGFSGSRKVSDKGIAIACDCVEQLSEKDICIVSGYASGVDHIVQKAAMEQNLPTIIVLPEGIENFRIKQEFKEIWDWDKVLVLSEFMPNDKWMQGRAMTRNNTIVGLSDIMIVVEAGESGGSFDAGTRAIEKGKYLFVPQYNIAPTSALGNNILINKGAWSIKMNSQTGKANLSKIFSLLEMDNKYSLF